MQENVKSISSDFWNDFDRDAIDLGFNRSQFHDYLYRFWKRKDNKSRIIITLLLLIFCIQFLLFMTIFVWGV